MRRSLHLLPIALQGAAAFGLVFTTVGCGGSSPAAETGGHDAGPTVVDSGAVSDDAGTEDAGTEDAGAADTGVDAGPQVIAVPILACEEAQYVASMTIGGTQTFNLLLDTGSTSLGVAGSTCSTCKVTPLYKPGSTAVDQKTTGYSPYETGSWSGEIYQDSVGFVSDPSVAMKFVSITSESGFFPPGADMRCGPSGAEYQGIIGLGRPAAEVAGTNPFFDQYYKAKGIANVFSIEFCDNGGTLWLGGWDATVLTGTPQYVPVTNDIDGAYYYTVGLTSITVGDGTSGDAGADASIGVGDSGDAGITSGDSGADDGGTDDGGGDAGSAVGGGDAGGGGTAAVPIASSSYPDTVVDTGTNGFLLASDAFNGVVAALTASPGVVSVFGANTQVFTSGTCGAEHMTKAEIDSTLPPLLLSFGTTVVKALPSESYLAPDGVYWCSTMAPQTQGDDTFPFGAVLGAPFLRSNVIIYDRAANRIGFAPHTTCN